MVKLNKKQAIALHRKWKQDGQGMSYLAFRRTVHAGWDCVMVHWSGLWLGIELDGYCHS